MFQDDFYQISNGEIYVKTQCIQRELALHNFLASLVESLGYYETGELKRLWQRDRKKEFYQVQQKIVICFADSFAVCGDIAGTSNNDPTRWFSNNTVVITDNHILFDPAYKVCQLPSSYFGIFNYIPADQNFRPQRRFSFSVNRFDSQRQLLFLEFLRQVGGLDNALEQDYINFNVWNPDGPNETLENLKQTFTMSWDQSNPLASQYQTYYDQAINALPIRNHNLAIEQSHVSAYLNLVVETYADDAAVALSEKIFRALVTPAPWTVYASTNAVNYLKSLGFDVLDDLVDHSYNSFQGDRHEKTIKYFSSSLDIYQHLISQPIGELTKRCQQAAKHNQAVLISMQKQWPADFAAWLPGVISRLE
jgi:hypothetical protein